MARPKFRTLLKEPFDTGDHKTLRENIKHIVWLEENTCDKHRHPYINHYGCYEREFPNTGPQEKVGYFDIEATNLKANFGIVICWCIKPAKAKKIIEYCVTPAEIKDKTCRDRRAIEELVKSLVKFDRIVVHYGGPGRFDFPFVRARAANMGIAFPKHKTIWVTDTWVISKKQFCLHSNRLEVLGEFLGVKVKKTKITSEHWLGSLTGDQDSLDYVLDHCQRDVKVLEQVYAKIADFAPRSKTSI
jgi:uncharacterized protein YprB with RNaseH-like and TPR domain